MDSRLLTATTLPHGCVRQVAESDGQFDDLRRAQKRSDLRVKVSTGAARFFNARVLLVVHCL
jgi:hypothetical protein